MEVFWRESSQITTGVQGMKERVTVGLLATVHSSLGVLVLASSSGSLIWLIGLFLVILGCYLWFLTLFGSEKSLGNVIHITLNALSK